MEEIRQTCLLILKRYLHHYHHHRHRRTYDTERRKFRYHPFPWSNAPHAVYHEIPRDSWNNYVAEQGRELENLENPRSTTSPRKWHLCRSQNSRDHAQIRTHTDSSTGGRPGAGTVQPVVCWARCPAWYSVASSSLLWATGRGFFSLGLTWFLTPFPPNSFGWEYKPRPSLCSHAFHRTDSKDPDIHVLDGWMPAVAITTTTKYTQNAPSTKTECNYLNGWIKQNGHIRKITPQMVNPRDI